MVIGSVCSIVFNPSGYILSVSRKDDPNARGLPGGKVEPGETLKQAAVRETLEETGIRIWGLVAIMTRKSRVSTCRGFLAHYHSGELSTEEAGIPAWVPPTHLLQGPFKEYNKQLLVILKDMGYEIF